MGARDGGRILLAEAEGGERRLARFAWRVVGAIYVLVVIGGVVTSSDSGLGCGLHWPSCAGAILPPPTVAGVIEWSHRLVAGVVSVLILILAIRILRRAPAPRRGWLRRLAALLIGTLALQVVLGGVVVLTGTPASVVALHEGAALLLLDLALATALVLSLSEKSGPPAAGGPDFLGALLWLLAVWAGVTSMLGSYLAHLDASCPGFAACLAKLAHEGGAFGAGLWHWLAALVLAGGLAVVFLRRARLPVRARNWLGWSVTALAVQASLGVLLLAGLSPVVLALHEAVGMATGALLCGTATVAGVLGLRAARPPVADVAR